MDENFSIEAQEEKLMLMGPVNTHTHTHTHTHDQSKNLKYCQLCGNIVSVKFDDRFTRYLVHTENVSDRKIGRYLGLPVMAHAYSFSKANVPDPILKNITLAYFVAEE